MVNKYDKDWFLSDMYYTKLVKDPKDYPNFKFEIIFQTFQKVRANQSFLFFLKWHNDKVRGKKLKFVFTEHICNFLRPTLFIRSIFQNYQLLSG